MVYGPDVSRDHIRGILEADASSIPSVGRRQAAGDTPAGIRPRDDLRHDVGVGRRSEVTNRLHAVVGRATQGADVAREAGNIGCHDVGTRRETWQR